MELTKEQEINAQIVQKAWDDEKFKKDLIANPAVTIEKLTGQRIAIPQGKELKVVDQMDESTIYFNLPRKIDVDSLQLNDEQLEMVSGGLTPTFVAIGYGIMAGVAFYAATGEDDN